MRIAIDSDPLSSGHAGRGIGVYTKLLSEALVDTSNQNASDLELVDVSHQRGDTPYDVIHYPSFDFFSPTFKPKLNARIVVTIHDTIPLLYPKHYPPGIKGKLAFLRQRRSLQKADAIITDSETSKKDIVRLLQVDSSKVYPIYLAKTVSTILPQINTQEILNKFKIDFPYVLYVGDVNWNKNLPNLARACVQAKVHLVIVGKKAISADFDRKHIENKPLVELQTEFGTNKYIHRIGFVLDEELPVIIKNATLLCQPSYYEGFGLSVLDAMSLGVPTACAKTQTLVELYESASVFFDPYSVSDMAAVISHLFFDKSQQSQLSKQGLKLARTFSWERCARQTFDVYKRVYSGS